MIQQAKIALKPKPFYPEELIAKSRERQRERLRRPAPPSRLHIGRTVFDRNRSVVETGGTARHLSARQSEILSILAQNVGCTVARRHLLQTVWGHDSYANSLALNVQISYLRKLLAADPSLSIISLKKQGLRLEVAQPSAGKR